MQPFVFLEMVLVLECLTALVALVWPKLLLVMLDVLLDLLCFLFNMMMVLLLLLLLLV